MRPGGSRFAKSGAKAAGKEFSHFVPARMGGARAWWNGNYVSAARHYAHDAFRYPSGWRAMGPKLPPGLAQIDRIPDAFKGVVAGLAYGESSIHSQDVCAAD